MAPPPDPDAPPPGPDGPPPDPDAPPPGSDAPLPDPNDLPPDPDAPPTDPAAPPPDPGAPPGVLLIDPNDSTPPGAPKSITQRFEYSVENRANNLLQVSTGYGADLSTASSWISVGENNGTFNPDNYTWSSVKNGMWMETSHFLNKACPAGICNSDGKNLTLEQQKLQAMQIPVVEVGRTNLSGSWNSGVNSINVNMKDVVFFAPNNGQPPSLWATDKITGQYTGNPTGAIVPLQGDGLHSQFNLQQWDTQNNTWLSTVTNGQGSIINGGPNTENINFQGAGAGQISPINETFSGTASGISQQRIP